MKKVINLFTVGTMFLAVTVLSSCKKEEILQPKTAAAATVSKTPEIPVGNQALHGLVNMEDFQPTRLAEIFRFHQPIKDSNGNIIYRDYEKGTLDLVSFTGDIADATETNLDQMLFQENPKTSIETGNLIYSFSDMKNSDPLTREVKIKIMSEKGMAPYNLFKAELTYNGISYQAWALLSPDGKISEGCTDNLGVVHNNPNGGKQIFVMRIYYNTNQVIALNG